MDASCTIDHLVDRGCAWLDGHCDCPFEIVESYGLQSRRPICKKYGKEDKKQIREEDRTSTQES